MSINLSAIKRDQLTLRNRSQNKKYKSAIKKSIKRYLLNLDDNKNLLNNLSIVYKTIDKAVKRGVLHKNKGARTKARLAKKNNHK
uniref:Ribosomal protein S20 n=2 Tax=Membranoptera TaxID=158697 RepID=A0A1L1YA59_9FLOR|nr:ribosomal protein S20 [Membranoptera weeksiae]YP_009332929.1 ribosomal protein S20 [Membranoptera tenuis]AHZ94723.1 ribosomal protein S20 [Membranoptera weeksiae]AKL79185.1 ribosomal protein S20 [Membranoptera tenuis]